MKPRIVITFTIVVILLMASWALALGRTSQNGTSTSYTVDIGSVTGTGYQLNNLTWQISGVISGKGYFISDPSASAWTESGCCCTYMPCVIR